jgi:hypothetical protein
MKKYTNTTTKMVCVEFSDFAQFLRRGESVLTDKAPKKVPAGVIVEDFSAPSTSKKK